MKRLFIVALAILLTPSIATIASAASITATGAPALALAAVVGDHSPLLTTTDRHLLLRIFGGNLSFVYPANQKISVTADAIVCRTSNVDISARSCKLTFGTHVRNLTGRKANELNATEIQAGVPSDGAAGTIFESLSHLACTIDPSAIKQRAGGGANCTFDTGP